MAYEDFSYYISEKSGGLGPRYYGSNCIFAQGNFTFNPNILNAVPFFVGVAQEIDELAVWGVPPFGPGAMFQLGIYKAGWVGDVANASIYPKELIVTGDETELINADDKQAISIIPTTLGPSQLYYAVYLSDNFFNAVYVDQFICVL